MARLIPKVPRSKLCAVPPLYSTEHFSKGRKGRKGAEKREGRGVANKGGKIENNSDHPHPPYLQKNTPPKYAIQQGSVWRKSRLNSRDFYRKYGIRTPKIWHTDPPPFMPYEPFLLGVGVVFNLLKNGKRTRENKSG